MFLSCYLIDEQEACVRYLLERRAIIDLRDDLGYNAVDVGRLLKRKELVDLLEQHQQNRSGNVPVFEMFWAISFLF